VQISTRTFRPKNIQAKNYLSFYPFRLFVAYGLGESTLSSRGKNAGTGLTSEGSPFIFVTAAIADGNCFIPLKRIASVSSFLGMTDIWNSCFMITVPASKLPCQQCSLITAHCKLKPYPYKLFHHFSKRLWECPVIGLCMSMNYCHPITFRSATTTFCFTGTVHNLALPNFLLVWSILVLDVTHLHIWW